MHRILHQPNGRAPLCQEEDTGDTFIEMILQPAVMDEVDAKENSEKKEEDARSDEEESEDEQEDSGARKKSATKSKRLDSEKKKRLKDEMDDNTV